VIKLSEVGTGTLEDLVFVGGDWIADEANQDIARRFLKATFQGWVYCRDNFEGCLDIVLANGPILGEGHMRWQLNEINALIWPNTLGIGVMDPASFDVTNQIATDYGIGGQYVTRLLDRAALTPPQDPPLRPVPSAGAAAADRGCSPRSPVSRRPPTRPAPRWRRPPSPTSCRLRAARAPW